MRLFIYDHCPYCVKARMIFGFKNRDVEIVTLLNDDEASPISMIGQKMLPILQKDNGDFMSESLDIIAYVDNLDQKPIVKKQDPDPWLHQWLQEMRRYHYALAMPRWIHLGLEEFATEGARAYFTHKKEKMVGPFATCLQRTPQLLEMARTHFLELEKKMKGSSSFYHGDSITLDDFHLFASLRCLTMVKEFHFPSVVESYLHRISKLSKIPLHSYYHGDGL